MSELRRLLACSLVFVLNLPSLPAQVGQQSTVSNAPDPRALHLLSRFSFGPTPEDLAMVRKTGVDAWFEQQLHPDRIPDEALNTRLAEYPALSLPVDQLLYRFPSGAEIRQAAKERRPIPNDPVLDAIYRRHIALYEEKQAKKADNKTETTGMAGTAGTVGQTGMSKQTVVAMPTPPVTDSNRPRFDDLLVRSTLALQPAQRIDHIFAMPPAEYEQLRANLKGPQKAKLTEDMTPQQRELVLDYENPTRTVVEELQSQRLLRDIYSSRQLQEVMTTFWLNHFNVYLHKNDEAPYFLVSYERDVIRPHALGNFEDLLVATATSPAMMLYLDNATSTGPDSQAAEKQKLRAAQGRQANPKKATPPGLNENYARELMELHTLGVNGGYSQKDVTEVAKVFTGWTVDKPGQGGSFKFDETRHQPGTKFVLGKKIKENGQKEGLQLLHTLATSPATAHFISQELAVAFVSDNPPPALVNRMAQSFLHSQGDIPSVLRTLLHSPEFWAPEAIQTKVKTPLEYVVSAARATGTDVTNTQPLINALNQMGMPLYACVPPTGYSAKASDWVSTGSLVTRMNFALSLSTNHFPGITSSFSDAQLQISSLTDAERSLENQLIPTGVGEKTRNAILSQVTTVPTGNVPVAAKPPDPARQMQLAWQQNSQLAGLLLGSPEFQRR